MVANISRIRRAFLDDLWTSEGEPDRVGRRWWELWLDTTRPSHHDIDSFVGAYGLRSVPRSLTIRDRRIIWVEPTPRGLDPILVTSIPIAEIRRLVPRRRRQLGVRRRPLRLVRNRWRDWGCAQQLRHSLFGLLLSDLGNRFGGLVGAWPWL